VSALPRGAATYLKSLGLGKPLVARVTTAYKFWGRLLPATIDDLFVSEYVGEEGDRNYDSLWLLSSEFLVEAHQFVTEDHGDVVRITHGFSRIDIVRRDFELDAATERSRLTVTVDFGAPGLASLSGSFRATGDNCLKLQDLLETRFLPNLSQETVRVSE
jgi:hypothetical protein